MSKMVPVRLDEELIEKMDARGNRSDVIRAALVAYLNPSQPATEEQPRRNAVEPERARPIRPEHDPSSCRTYRCGLCAVAKTAR